MAIVKIETLPTNEYKLMLNGNEWEKDWNYNSDTGDYDLYEYVEKDLPTGQVVEIGIQAKEGYKLIPPTTITGGEYLNDDTGDYDVENYELTGNENYVNAMIDIKSVDYNFLNHDGWLLNVETSTSDTEPEPEPEPETKIVKATNNKNVVIYFNGEVWEITEYYDDVSGDYVIGRQNKEVTENFNVIIEPIEGYIFGKNSQPHHKYDNLVFEYLVDDYIIHEYEGDEYSQSLEYDFNWDTDIFYVPSNIINLVVADRPDTGDFPYNKIYRMTESALNDLSSYSYVEEMQQSGYVFNDVVVNYGQYITGLYVFPYEITQGEETTVLLGTQETNVKGRHISDYIQNVDLGEILIPVNGTENVGYSNITIDLYVPYFGNINLDVDEVLSNIISLNLKLNMLSGKGTLNVINTKTDTTIHSQTTQIGVKIPYEIADNVSVNIGTDVLETDYNVPYVEMKVLKPDNETKFNSVNKITIDDSYTFIKDSDDVMLFTSATEREQRLIKDFISRGIFVRK